MNRHGRKIPSFILMTLLMSFLIVSAACAETVVSERLDVDGTPSWPPGVAVTIKVGPVRSSYGKPMLIEGYTINNEAINTAGYLGSVAFISHDDGRGAVLAQLTINNASGTHNLLVAVRNRSFLIDQCTVNFAENSQGAPYIWAYSEGGSGTIQKTTFTGNGGNNNVVLRVGGTNNNDDLAGGEITLSGVTYHNINGQFRLQGPLNIAAGETVLIEERETVLSNSTITAHTKSHETAKITINEGAKLSVRSSTFDLLQKPSIVVKSGATLEVNNAELKNMTITGEPGSTITFSGKKNSLDHVVINTKGKVTSGKTEIVFKNGSEINLMESTDPAVFDETTMELGGNGSTVFLSIAKNREASIKKGSKVINGQGTAESMVGKGFITVNGKLEILKSEIYDNSITAETGVRSQGSVIRVNQDGELKIAGGSSFKNNNVQGGFGGAIRLVKAKSLTIDGATFTGNQALHGGAIRMEGVGTVEIKNTTFTDNLAGTGASGGAIDGREVTMSITGTEFSGNGAAENAATNHGGAIAIYESTVDLEGCTFQSNRGNYGGALLLKGGQLTIKGSEFSENSGVWGGAVTVEGDFLWDDSWSAENPPQETVEATSTISLDISGTTFDRNTATTCGGALALGFEYGGYYSTKDVIQATIGGGTSFTNNSVSDCTVGEAGGAIFLNNDATLRMNRVAIYGNTAQDDGGAISNCPNGATIVNVRNGAAIYDNYVGSDGNLSRQDLMMGHTKNPHVIGEIMFNGGLHRWDPPVSDMIAEHYTSDPEEKYKNPAGAQVSFTGNSAMDRGGNSELLTRGGAIGNNGVLIIGDAGTWVEITKYWDDDQNLKNGKKYSDLFRPEMEDFLRSLQVYRVDSENNRLPMLNWDRAVFQKIGSGESAYWLVTNLGIFYGDSGTSEDPFICVEARHDTATDAELVTVWNLMDIPGIAYEVGETLDGYATEIQSEKKVIKRKMVGADAPGSQEYEIEETYWEVIMYNLPDTVDIMVTKKWDDDHNRDGIRPQASDFEDAVRVFYSYETGEKTITGEVDMNTLPIQVYVTDNQDDTYTIHVAGLPEYSPEGIHIHYTIGEGDIPGYTKDTDTAAPDGVLTNWHDTEKTNIVVRKQWSDVGHVDARPETITVRLHANGEVVAVQQMKKADQWKAVHFLDLPVYEDGEPIVYTITEDAVKDYTHHIDEENHIITNTYNPGKTDIDVEKVWHDSHNRDGIRPRMVMVHLYADGVDTGRTLQLSEDNQWYGAFENLDEKKNGETIVYTVRENPVDGYETEITGDAETVFSVVNTHESKTTSIMVQKIWNDAGHESARPESITVRLHANGAEIAAREMTRESNWAPVVFEDLPAYDHGFGVVYTITEDVVPNYTHHIDQQADTITNTYHPGMTSIDVEKVWRDGNNEKNTRPQFVTVRLYADGVDTGKTLILDEASRWAGTFEELEKHRNGHEIVYTVREEPVAGYMAHIGGSMHVGYTLTNTLTGSGNGGEGEFREFNPYTHRFSFTKVWRGGTGDSIEWTLYGSDGTEVHKAFNKTVVSDSEWQYEAWFSRNDDFYVVETVPAGYMVIYENTGAHSGVTDRCYNGGRIINYKMPRTGDPDRIALWAGMSLLSLMGMALILRRRGKNR